MAMFFFLQVEEQEDVEMCTSLCKLILTTNFKIRTTQLNAFYHLIMMYDVKYGCLAVQRPKHVKSTLKFFTVRLADIG